MPERTIQEVIETSHRVTEHSLVYYAVEANSLRNSARGLVFSAAASLSVAAVLAVLEFVVPSMNAVGLLLAWIFGVFALIDLLAWHLKDQQLREVTRKREWIWNFYLQNSLLYNLSTTDYLRPDATLSDLANGMREQTKCDIDYVAGQSREVDS